MNRPSENIVGKDENPGIQHFLLFPQSFLLFTGSLYSVNHTPIEVFVICFQSVSLGKDIGSPVHNTHMRINSLPKDKMLDLSKLAAFADEARACDDCPLEPFQLRTFYVQ